MSFARASSPRTSYTRIGLHHARAVNVALLASALVLAACGGARSAESPSPGSAPAKASPNEGAGKATDSAGGAPAGRDAASSARVRDPEALAKHVELVGAVGAVAGASAGCSLLALKQFKFAGARDLLYMQTGVHPKNVDGPGPMCEVQVFSPTEQPRLQWNVTVTAAGGGKMRTERKRPETFRAPSPEEATRLAAVLAAVKTTNGRGLMVPIVITSPDGWVVYLMRYSDKPDTLAVGPHYRVFVSPDGKTVNKTELLSDGEDMSLSMEGGKRVDALKFPFDKPVPNEAHAFMSVMARMPLIVKTELGGWLVSNKKIQLIEPAAAAKP
jgi:hypothetical protein